MRYRYGNPISALPSRFIAEIDENLIQRSSQQQNNSIEKIKPDIGPDDVKWIKALARKGDESKTSGKNGQFKIGQNVIHAVFGDGKIVKVQGFDSDLKLIVDFASVGRKTLMAQYANLIVRK
jgi:DNA helicase-2/ATP-dependent DNA helicase PcrA